VSSHIFSAILQPSFLFCQAILSKIRESLALPRVFTSLARFKFPAENRVSGKLFPSSNNAKHHRRRFCKGNSNPQLDHGAGFLREPTALNAEVSSPRLFSKKEKPEYYASTSIMPKSANRPKPTSFYKAVTFQPDAVWLSPSPSAKDILLKPDPARKTFLSSPMQCQQKAAVTSSQSKPENSPLKKPTDLKPAGTIPTSLSVSSTVQTRPIACQDNHLQAQSS